MHCTVDKANIFFAEIRYNTFYCAGVLHRSISDPMYVFRLCTIRLQKLRLQPLII